MSDDRFKQARRSLYEQHEQRQQGFDDFEDEATALVDITGAPQPAFSPPPGYTPDSGPTPPAPSGRSLQIGVPTPVEGEATEFINLRDMPPAQDSFGEGGGFEGNTQFVNLNEVNAQGPPPNQPMQMQSPMPNQMAPPLNQMGMGDATRNPSMADLAATGGNLLHDPVLTQSYRYGPESIQDDGPFTLIFAQNATGQQVVLKRVFSGDANQLPPELQARITEIDGIRHPRLVGMVGMLAAPSGVWVDIPRPPGYRLTDIINQNGPQPQEAVGRWAAEAADVLETIHAAGHVYASLTPDAIWVQDDGGVMLEPFDVLSFEDRGDLQPFGPREMAFPPDQRVLSPTTDTFCLATTSFAALTGLPLNMDKAGDVNPKFGKAFQEALAPNPAERPTPKKFAKPFAPKKKGQLPDLDMKFLIIGIGSLLFITSGVFYYQKVQADAAAEALALANQRPVAQEIAEGQKDPRIKVTQRYRARSDSQSDANYGNRTVSRPRASGACSNQSAFSAQKRRQRLKVESETTIRKRSLSSHEGDSTHWCST